MYESNGSSFRGVFESLVPRLTYAARTMQLGSIVCMQPRTTCRHCPSSSAARPCSSPGKRPSSPKSSQSYGGGNHSISPTPAAAHQTERNSFLTRASSAAPTHGTRGAGPTVGPDIEAELGQVIFLPDARPYAPYVQRITVDRCATCPRSGEAQYGPPQLQTGSQLCHG